MTMYLATLSTVKDKGSYNYGIDEFNVGIFDSRADAEEALRKRFNLEYFKEGGIDVFCGTIYELEVGHVYVGGDYNRPEHPYLPIDRKYIDE